MAGPNTNTSGEWFEANENSAPNSENKYSKLVKSYVGKKLNAQSQRLAFAKKIKSSSTIPDEILSEIEAHKGTNAEFAWLEINTSTISLSTLQWELWSFLVGVESKKLSLRSTFLQEYDISPQDYTKYISAKIESISKEEDLKKLLDSDISRDEFLKAIYKKWVPKRRLIVNILKGMNIEKKLSQLEGHLEREFMDTVAKMQRREKLETSDFMVLFESNIFSVSEKQKLIESFMPSISLADALVLWIIDTRTAEWLKKKALESSLDTWIFRGVNLDSYISAIQDSDLIISTQGLFSTAKSQEQLFDQNLFFEKYFSHILFSIWSINRNR
jgi:hypothetical protein